MTDEEIINVQCLINDTREDIRQYTVARLNALEKETGLEANWFKAELKKAYARNDLGEIFSTRTSIDVEITLAIPET